jgi:hypothetical protein
VNARKASAEEALTALNRISERQTAEAERTHISAEIDLLSWAIPLFHSDRKSNHASALNNLSRNEQAAFLDACNARLEPFGVRLGVQAGAKSLSVTFGGLDGGAMVPITQVSGAEMLLAEWAVATAFVGDGLVLIDEFNRLDGAYRPIMCAALGESPCSVWAATAYLQATTPDIDAIRAALEPVGVAWLERTHGDAVSEVAAA